MTKPTDTTTKEPDATTELLWMVCRKGGDVLVRWEDMTLAEQQDAHRHHNKIHGIEA